MTCETLAMCYLRSGVKMQGDISTRIPQRDDQFGIHLHKAPNEMKGFQRPSALFKY
jgi:hypothetical protein